MKIKTVPHDKISSAETPNMSIVERIETVIEDNRLIAANDRVIVAVSGGSDSLALLYLLREIKMPLQLLAVYIDHGLRPQETPHERQAIEHCCRSLGIPYMMRSVDIHRLIAEEKRSPEEAARILRYQALEEVCRENGAQVIATGHTADDQVEEFFLRLIRGSSRRGLSGMALRRGRIIRPLLHETKDALADYLTALKVEWCLDSSNLQRHFLRNRVRLDLLPLLEQEFNPAIRRTVLRNMDILAEEESYLEMKTEEAFARCVSLSSRTSSGENRLQLVVHEDAFTIEHLALRRRILEKCFWRMGIRPVHGQINILVQFMESGTVGREIHLDDGVRVEKHRSRLLFCRPLEKGRKRGSRAALPGINLSIAGPGRHLVQELDGELVIEETAKPATAKSAGSRFFVDRAKITFPLLLRSALPGETFHPCNSPGKKKISRYFNDRKIAAKERAEWPVLLCGDSVIALPGLQIDHEYRVTETTTEVLAISWLRKTPNS